MIGHDDEGDYIFYPDPVESNGIGYDTMFERSVDTDGVVAAANIPGRPAIYWGSFEVAEDSPLRSDDPAVRERALVRITALLGKRVEQAAQE